MDSFEFDNRTGLFADIYRRVLARVRNKLRGEYIYHTNRLEGSLLHPHVTRKILSEKPVNNSKFRANDIIMAHQTIRAMKFVYRMVSNPIYNISEADIRPGEKGQALTGLDMRLMII